MSSAKKNSARLLPNEFLKLISARNQTQVISTLGVRLSNVDKELLSGVISTIRKHQSEEKIFKSLSREMDPKAIQILFQHLYQLGVISIDGPSGLIEKSSELLISAENLTTENSSGGPFEGNLVVAGLSKALKPLAMSTLKRGKKRTLTVEFQALEKLDFAQLRTILKDSGLFIAILPKTNLETIEHLARICEKSNSFFLPVFPLTDGVQIGPMLPPGIPSAFQKTYLGGLSQKDQTFGDQIINGMGPENKLIWQKVFELLNSISRTPTLPLLWQAVQVGKSSVTSCLLDNTSLVAMESTSSRLSIQQFLNPLVATSATAIGRSLKNGNLISLKSAFSNSFAELIYRALDSTQRWKIQEDSRPGFFYHHHNIYDPNDFPPEIRTAQLIFNSTETKKWASKISGRDCSRHCSIGASWYRPGDHSLPHEDLSSHRQTSFVWHLAKNWNSSWGGQLFWAPSLQLIDPEFNTLHLFNVSLTSSHNVCLVNGGALSKRLTINGWWNSIKENKIKPKIKNHRSLTDDGSILEYFPFKKV